MNRGILLVSFLIAILSAYGQQQVQWFDVSHLAPSVRQCMVSLTEDRLFIYVNTGDKDINFWVEEPQRTGALLVLNGNDMTEYRQIIFDKFISESLKNLPTNAVVQRHAQQETEESIIDPLANFEIEVQTVDKNLLEEGLSNEDIAKHYASQPDNNQTNNPNANTSAVMSGFTQQRNQGMSQQQANQETKVSDENSGGLYNIFALLIGFWLLKAILKGFFSSSPKSSSDKNYKDGPAWFHDHGHHI